MKNRSDTFYATPFMLNPVKANMVKQAENWKWSSYAAKVGLSSKAWLDFDVCYMGLSTSELGRQNIYRQFVEG